MTRDNGPNLSSACFRRPERRSIDVGASGSEIVFMFLFE